MRSWEIPSIKATSIHEPYDVGIMLGGAMRYYNSDMDRIVYGKGVDRFLHVISLYQEGKIKKILLSGGSGLLTNQQYKEADLLKDLLLKMNIHPEDIIVENKSKNTRQNALFTSEIIQKSFAGKKILLITSGYHMRRSLKCFEKTGLHADPFSVDEYSGKGLYTPDKIIIPDAEYLNGWDILMHEWVGYFSYWLAGYI